jgi:hypothetical protein
MLQRIERGIISASLLAAALAFIPPARAEAMPSFAKAYGLECSACHTLVPGLNAYGRYVQRTGYASLDRDVLKKHLPFWLGEQVNGDSTGGVSANSDSAKVSAGNIAIHAAGYLSPDITYHVQQWLLENDRTGGSLDTAWLTYNNLFHRDGHLFVGKIEAPAPSPFGQWFDISSFSSAGIAVGEHTYQLDANRWGAKLAYVHGPWDLEGGWLLSGNGLPSGSDFHTTPGTDKTFQWKIANASGDRPYEVGLYGSSGSFIVSTGDADRYTSVAGYFQLDPNSHGVPGFLTIYQIGNDSNPGLDGDGNQLAAARSRAFSAEVYEPLFNNSALIGYRTEYTDDGLGTMTHYGNVDFAFTVPHVQYLHGYVEASLGGNSGTENGTPAWRWFLWWTTPLGR